MFTFVKELFRSKPSAEDLARVAKEDGYRAAVKNLTTFPGNLEEFNQLAACEHVILDTGKPEKAVAFRTMRSTKGGEVDQRLVQSLIARGCVGFIHVLETEGTERYAYASPRSAGGIVTRDYRVWWGVPIARKV